MHKKYIHIKLSTVIFTRKRRLLGNFTVCINHFRNCGIYCNELV